MDNIEDHNELIKLREETKNLSEIVKKLEKEYVMRRATLKIIGKGAMFIKPAFYTLGIVVLMFEILTDKISSFVHYVAPWAFK
jgi:hypothetical protein